MTPGSEQLFVNHKKTKDLERYEDMDCMVLGDIWSLAWEFGQACNAKLYKTVFKKKKDKFWMPRIAKRL